MKAYSEYWGHHIVVSDQLEFILNLAVSDQNDYLSAVSFIDVLDILHIYYEPINSLIKNIDNIEPFHGTSISAANPPK